MLVGHTHDDIDALFRRWSMELQENDCSTIPLLMKSYMDPDEDPIIHGLIEEVLDFKEFVKPYISDWTYEGERISSYRGKNGNPLMQYKLQCMEEKWLLEEGVQLWKVNLVGLAWIPSRIPEMVLPHSMKEHNNIVKGLNGNIQY